MSSINFPNLVSGCNKTLGNFANWVSTDGLDIAKKVANFVITNGAKLFGLFYTHVLKNIASASLYGFSFLKQHSISLFNSSMPYIKSFGNNLVSGSLKALNIAKAYIINNPKTAAKIFGGGAIALTACYYTYKYFHQSTDATTAKEEVKADETKADAATDVKADETKPTDEAKEIATDIVNLANGTEETPTGVENK